MSQAPDLGKISCSLRRLVVAGSYQTCVLTYTAGQAGIDDTGSLKVVMRYATDCGVPQFTDPEAPNYTTAVASNGAHLQLRYDVKDNIRPWGKTIHVKVLQGYLRQGDRISLTLGDRSGGSPGWRVQTFAEDTFELRVLVDRYATYAYEPLPFSPTFRIVAGPPARLIAIVPSLLKPGARFSVRTRLEDSWGNPVGRPRSRRQKAFTKPGCYTLTLKDEKSGLLAETNPILVRQGDHFGRYWADLHGQSEETIGTNSIEAYFRFARDCGFLDICAHQGNDFQITDDFWTLIQLTTREYYQPDKFVTFPGWEWSGNTGLGGDRNVLYRREGGVISRSSRALVSEEEAADPCSTTVEELFAHLKSQNADVMLVPHVGGRYADLERHEPKLEPVVEVHSAWGTFEWMLEDAFRRGYRVGIVANSDGHKGRPGVSYPGASTFGSYGGLTCVLAEKLDRDSVWDAYQARRVYATTGARILLDIATDQGDLMGSVVKVAPKDLPTIHVRAHGTAAIERIEVRQGMRVVRVERPYRAVDLCARVKILWQGAEVRGRGRQVSWDGRLHVSGNRVRGFTPLNFHNLEKTCRQTSSRELVWQSTTTGGVAGLIVELESATGGQLRVETAQKKFQTAIRSLSVRGRSYGVGGVGKRISAYRLPPAGGCRELHFSFTPSWEELQPGDNPLYICLVQEDGHMAWSSPIYLVRP